MNKPLSQLTYKILAYTEIQQVDTNDAIDWAMEMMELGHESPTLDMLAGCSKPVNYFEVINDIKAAVRELGLEMKSGDAAVISYASYYIRQIAKGQKVRENLTELYLFCLARDYEDHIYDFYLLHFAWDDLDREDSPDNHYWSGARRNNIEQIVGETAQKWLKENKAQDIHISERKGGCLPGLFLALMSW